MKVTGGTPLAAVLLDNQETRKGQDDLRGEVRGNCGQMSTTSGITSLRVWRRYVGRSVFVCVLSLCVSCVSVSVHVFRSVGRLSLRHRQMHTFVCVGAGATGC